MVKIQARGESRTGQSFEEVGAAVFSSCENDRGELLPLCRLILVSWYWREFLSTGGPAQGVLFLA